MARGRIALIAHELGFVAIVFGFAQLHARVLAPNPYHVLTSPRLPWTVLFLGLLTATAYALGLPNLQRSRLGVLSASAITLGVSVLGVSLVQSLLGTPLLPRSVLALTAVTVPLWSLLTWNAAGDYETATRDRVLVVGARPDDVAALRRELSDYPERPAVVVGEVSLDQLGSLTADRSAALLEQVRATGPNVLVIDSAAQADADVVHAAAGLHREGMRVRTLSLFYEEWLGKIPLAELEKVAMLFDIGEIHRDQYSRVKRLADLAIALPGLVVLAPVGLALAALNPFFNQGPLIFRQQRVGKGGQTFSTLKFRSMLPLPADAAPGNAMQWTADTDPRVTTLGRWLRRLHLDELPQLVNIVRGDLSLVGPRPEQPHYVEELRTKLPFYDARLLVRPGLTGWAQVKFGYASSESDALEKLQYDLYYLRRQSLKLDLLVLIRTARHMVRTGGQ